MLLTYRGSCRPTQRDSVTTALVIGARWCRAILFRRVASAHGSVRGLSKDTCRTSQGLSAADVSRLSVCSDCFSARHLHLISNQPMYSATLERTVWSQVCFWTIVYFAEWRKFLAQGERRCRKDVRQPRVAVKIGVLLTYRGSRRPTQRDSVTTALVIGARWCRAILFRRVASAHGSVRGLSKDTCRTSQG